MNKVTLSSDWPFCAAQLSVVQGALAQLHESCLCSVWNRSMQRCAVLLLAVLCCLCTAVGLCLLADTVLSRCAASDSSAAWIQLVHGFLKDVPPSTTLFSGHSVVWHQLCPSQFCPSYFGRIHTLKVVKYSANRVMKVSMQKVVVIHKSTLVAEVQLKRYWKLCLGSMAAWDTVSVFSSEILLGMSSTLLSCVPRRAANFAVLGVCRVHFLDVLMPNSGEDDRVWGDWERPHW